MDWNTLPDLLALTALVAVFSSLLPRKADSSLRLWLVAWILIVIHFAAKFSDASGQNIISGLLTVGTLVLAGLTFMWAAVSRSITWSGCLVFASLAIPMLTYASLGAFNIHDRAPYIYCVFVGFALPVVVMMRTIRVRTDRILAILSCALLAASLMAIIHYDYAHPDDGVDSILTWVYLGAGVLHWRRFRRVTAGILTTVFGFIAWGLVFPSGDALALWAPHVHIDDTAYNIPKYIVAIGLILMLLEEQMERSIFLSLHDELTGLPNRRKLEERLESSLERARRGGYKVALLTIDLDRFKSINDSYGHHAGDSFLRAVAQRFAGRVRKIDTCARLGGDEFVVIADQLRSREDAESMARDLLATLDEPIEMRGERVFAGASIGISLYPDDADDSETLRAVSDAAMYAAKRLHRRRDLIVAEQRAAG